MGVFNHQYCTDDWELITWRSRDEPEVILLIFKLQSAYGTKTATFDTKMTAFRYLTLKIKHFDLIN